jgi:ABC-type transporter Mla subunit MlaD
MVHFLVISIAIFVAFFVGVWLAPVVRGDYGTFKTYVENQIRAAEQAAKDKASRIVGKL